MQDSQRLLLSILSCLFLIQCSKNSASEKEEYIQELDSLTVYPADSVPAYEVDLVQEQSFGGGKDSGEPYLVTITGCVVDDNGRVIIRGENNNFKTGLSVFNPNGTYRKQIGQFGKGPGEYEFVSNNFQINAGRVFLHDEITKRLSFFSADDYSFEKTTTLQDWNVRDLKAFRDMKLSDFRARSDGNLLAIFSGIPTGSGRTANTKFMLVDTKGNVLNPEPLIELPSPFYIVNENRGNTMITLRMQLPLMGRSLYALSDDDAIYTAPRTEDFLIKKYDAEGSYQFAIYYPVMGPPFDIDSVRVPAGHSQRAIRNALEEADAETPETAPVLLNMRIDDENRIWVTVAVDREKSEWWMLGAKGKLLAKIAVPKNEAICDIQNGYLYTKFFNSRGSNDPANWEGKVVKYSINLTER